MVNGGGASVVDPLEQQFEGETSEILAGWLIVLSDM